jgi:hypothetical protein
VRLTKKD